MKSNIKITITILLIFVTLIEAFAIYYNAQKGYNSISKLEPFNPIPYLKALIYPQKKVKIVFPRIVKNGCGKFAVQISEHYGLTDNSKWDTIYYYVGIRQPTTFSIWPGGPPPFQHPTSYYDTNLIFTESPPKSIQEIKDNYRQYIFATDTIYGAEIGYELMFDKEHDAFNAMVSYMEKKIRVQVFNDSIDNCHNYKP